MVQMVEAGVNLVHGTS